MCRAVRATVTRPLGKANLVLGGTVSAQGVLYVHSAPPALCSHIEWAVARIVGAPVVMPWVSQPASPGSLRAELIWHARPGTAGAIASELAGWNRLRFEVTEDSSPGCDGVRHCYTPDLGIFTAMTVANGDIVGPENPPPAPAAAGPAGGAGVPGGRGRPAARPGLGQRARAVPPRRRRRPRP